MKISREDVRRIRLSLIAALAMVAAGVAAVLVTEQWHVQEQRISREAEMQRREVQSKLARARDEEAEIKDKIVRFDDLLARGVIGDERRLEWVELIRRIRSERRLLDLQYEISPQQPLESTAAPGSSGAYEFLASRMTLQMQLLHEDDLLNFLADLRQSASAIIRIRSCRVERFSDAREARAVAAQLRADCSLDWITVRTRTPAT